jgi:hypothetical protein
MLTKLPRWVAPTTWVALLVAIVITWTSILSVPKAICSHATVVYFDEFYNVGLRMDREEASYRDVPEFPRALVCSLENK